MKSILSTFPSRLDARVEGAFGSVYNLLEIRGISLTGRRQPFSELFLKRLRNVKQPSSPAGGDTGKIGKGLVTLSEIMAEKSRKDQQCSGLRQLLQDVNRQPLEYLVLSLRKVTPLSSPDRSDMEINGDAEQLSECHADLVWTSTKMDPCSSDFWRQRRLLCKKLGTKAASVELLVTKNHLYMDEKNELVWFHRKWVLDTFGGWENELEFCNGLLQRDIYNERAWAQRFFVILRCKTEIAEIDYALDAIVKDPENEYPWRMNITMHSKMYLCAMEALIHLVLLGYSPSKPVQDALAHICPTTEKKSTPVEQIRYILECTNEWSRALYHGHYRKIKLTYAAASNSGGMICGFEWRLYVRQPVAPPPPPPPLTRKQY
ncbi:Protein farnesyltransferase/geranylgeranyltransferase type-1 subunit alpha [Striga hermonthica]|uniref:Protein farnesyltransferase/geranylgeranyltransferase type-1 subunit alpha n=1 Tax=Striga hermonthica TaxID=68872 RepID=A0A9N7RKY7_STRHE|nr:Protein farnesyltransferase/geranylgeranyltransferase type-1 subunit alpha [Striga hermonthica]